MSISKYNNEGYPDPTAYDALSSIENEAHALRAFRPIVYICSPFAGDIEKNVAAARTYSRFAVEQGYIPIAPHLLFPQFLNDSDPKERELGLFFGNAIMSKCSEVWVLEVIFLPVWKQKSNEPSGRITACAISQRILWRFNTCTK